ncbi:MAG: tetratricopeptide repeat protein [Flavobacteriales bacterium]|nr:tetratricopeptide repeat protein [Flavobacteriales bacterium]
MRQHHLKYLFFLAVFSCPLILHAVDVDSLATSAQTERDDSTKVQLLLQLSKEYQNVDGKKSLENAEQAYYPVQKMGDSILTAVVFNQLGVSFYMLGELEKSRFYIEKALDIQVALNNEEMIATCLNNMGVLVYTQGKLDQALTYFLKSSEMKEGTEDFKGIAMTFNNIGNIHKDLGNQEKALVFYGQSLVWKEKIDDDLGIAMTLNNMGLVYMDMEDYDEAVGYYNKSIQVKKRINDQHGLAMTINNLGEVYTLQNKFGEALIMYQECLEILEEVQDIQGVARALANMADVYMRTERYLEAVDKLNISLKYARESGLKKQEGDYNNMLYIAHKALGNYDLALGFHDRHLFLSDSLLNKDNKQYIKEIQAEYEKKKAEREVKKYWINWEILSIYKWQMVITIVLIIGGLVFFRMRKNK